ncbi:MAG: hypothetical protein FJ253_06075, partial [Phycisphaerae bacterium]|nr:hypothetical protein [Phycisphaerae bacterium]
MRALLDLFSSVKLGVTLLVLLFLYMSIGSAGVIYPVHGNLLDPSSWRHEQIRQRPWLEMTEFEWFHWWPFDALLALIVINIVVTTLRRIPLKPVNYGVWMIHSGVLVLIAGSVIYFGTKVEGEAPVVRRSVVLSIGQSTSAATVPESAAASPAAAPTAAPARVAAMPGNRVRVGSAERGYDIEVLSTDPEWELLTGDAKGRRAFSVNLLVTGPDGKRFMRQLIDGHPDLTEDLVFTENREQPLQRAVKVTGEKLVDTALAATLEYESTRWFYLRNDISKAWALYVRRPDDRGWTMRPIDGLPLYNDWISSRDDVVVPERMDLPVRALDLRVPPIGPTDPLPNVTFTIGGYLRYAFERSRVVAGGPEAPPNPVASFTVRGPRGTMSSYTLAALDPESRSDDGGLVRMHAVKDEAGFAALLEPPTLRIRVPSLGIDASQPIDGVAMVEPDRPMTPVGGADSGYGYRVVGLEDDVALASGSTSLAIVEVVTPKGRFRRWVFDDPALTRDAPAGSGDPHAPPTVADDSISLEYSRGSGRAIVLLVTGPDPERLRVIGAIGGAAPSVVDAELGKSVEVGAGLTLELVRFTPRAVIETKPTIVAPEQRIRDAQELFSRIKLSAPGAAPKWIPFHPFVFDSAQEKLRRTEFRPTQFRLEDGTTAEVIFGRRREPLPTEIALDTFVLTSHIGGFTGETASIRDYTSVLRFRDPGASSPHGGGWSESTPVSVNEPVEHGGYWYFQAKWDPPDDARAQGERASRGLNYTILGVGNRQGVVVQLAGVVLAVIGMLYAFYVKPVIKRRRRAEVMAELERPGAKVGARPRAVANASLLLPLIAAVLLGAGAPPSAPTSGGSSGATSGGSSGASGVLPDGAAPTPPPSFAQRVNLEALESIAVHTEGRLKSF